jgi:hypothetical protein
VRVAIRAEQRFTRGFLRLVALCADVAAAVLNMPIHKTKHADVALAIERDVGQLGRILEIGPDAIKRAGES